MLKPYRGLYIDEIIKNGKSIVKIRVSDTAFIDVAEAKDPEAAEYIAREILAIYRAKKNIQSSAMVTKLEILPESMEELIMPISKGRPRRHPSSRPSRKKKADATESTGLEVAVEADEAIDLRKTGT